jgi:type I restriction enzyme, S subunit
MSELSLVPLSEFSEIVMGQSPGSESCNADNRGLPFLQGCGEFGQRNPNTAVFCSPPLRIAKAESVLISVRAPVGTTNYADLDYCIGRGLAAFKAKPGVANTVYLKHAVEHNVGYLHRRSQGSTFSAVSSGDVRAVPIPKFSLDAQRVIAAILTSIDTTIEKTEALIEKYQHIKAGLMHDLFTRGVLPNGQLRPPRDQAPELYQETAIGWIPLEWSLVPLEKCLQSAPKNGYSPRETDSWEGVHVLGLGCLTRSGFEPRQLKNAPGRLALTSGAVLNDGDFLISRANTPDLVGLCGVYRAVGAPTIYPDLMMRLSLNDLLDRYFLEAQLLHPATRTRLTALAVGTSSSMAKLNSSTIKRFLIFVPPKAEQVTIHARLKPVDANIRSLIKSRFKLQTQKLGLMHDLLTGKVAVKVNAQVVEAVA